MGTRSSSSNQLASPDESIISRRTLYHFYYQIVYNTVADVLDTAGKKEKKKENDNILLSLDFELRVSNYRPRRRSRYYHYCDYRTRTIRKFWPGQTIDGNSYFFFLLRFHTHPYPYNTLLRVRTHFWKLPFPPPR